MSTETPTCAGLSCKKPATTSCPDCEPPTKYCSERCLKADYKRHKKTRSGAEKSNCFLIRAAPNDGTPDNDHVEKFFLNNYGSEFAEKVELTQRLGWRSAHEGGKFYSHDKSVHRWYYFVYAQDSRDGNKPKNEIASRCTGRVIHGDVAVVRSSPLDYEYVENFSRGEFLKALDFYHRDDSSSVFKERERTRFEISMGLPPGSLAMIPNLEFRF